MGYSNAFVNEVVAQEDVWDSDTSFPDGKKPKAHDWHLHPLPAIVLWEAKVDSVSSGLHFPHDSGFG